MADVTVVGGGIAGLCGALLLARDGHTVTLLERDAAEPPPPLEAWETWERRGVNQFRMLHYFLPRFREIAERELPDVCAALLEAGALVTNPVANVPPELGGGLRPGDERFACLTGRRPFVESVVARVVAAEPGVDVRRGVAVRGVLTGEPAAPGVPHVTGVVTDAGDELRSDLVVDTSGRRSQLPAWLAAAGARPCTEELEDCGFVYYGRHFRSPDGSVPMALGSPLQPYDSVSILALPADNGTWGLGVITSAADASLRPLRQVDVWERVVRRYPMVAHWLNGEPISGVDVMAKIEDRHRRYWSDGEPVATGIVAVADAWACTNPSVGRGASIGLLHAACLRDVLREVTPSDPLALAARFDEVTADVVEPLYRDTLAFDRHRLAEMEAQIEGRPYETEDPSWLLGEALRHAALRDPDMLRAFATVGSLLRRGVEVMSEPGMAERAIELGQPEPLPGPDRGKLLALVGS